MERSFAHIGLNSCLWEASICRIKTALRESFYATYAGFCFEEFKPLRPVGDLGGKKVILSPRVGPENLPCVKVFDGTHGSSFAFMEW